MTKMSPSEALDKELRALLWSGVNGSAGGHILSSVIRTAAAKVIQEALECELTDFIGRERYEREKGHEDGPTVYRNGYKRDRKSTRLNSSHVKISYAVF